MNERAQGFRAGSPALVHDFQLYLKEGDEVRHASLIIPTGMKHRQEMQDYYDEALESVRKFKAIMLRHRHIGPTRFALIDRTRKFAGCGEFPPHERPEDMATIITMMMEAFDCRVALTVPDDCLAESAATWAKDVYAVPAQEGRA